MGELEGAAMKIEDAIGPVITALFLLAMLLERIAPREAQPPRRAWRMLGLAFFGISGAINIGLPLLIPVRFIETHALLPGTKLGVAGGAIVGFLAWGFIYYWFHRAEHRSDFLWRLLHQIHHSPSRMDVSGFAYTHPLEMIVTVLLSITLTVGVLGLRPEASGIVGLYSAVVAVVQHANVRTPQWLEWVMQRPEAHTRHHEHGEHAGNYADWPMWDKLLGTYRRPSSYPLRYGFDAEAGSRLGAMLATLDVNRGGVHELQHHE
jgi:sterol desaturase/sphingolipid hydroxylase (fatty acid hydroxylase superfamily)